jgi:hypothetical protein
VNCSTGPRFHASRAVVWRRRVHSVPPSQIAEDRLPRHRARESLRPHRAPKSVRPLPLRASRWPDACLSHPAAADAMTAAVTHRPNAPVSPDRRHRRRPRPRPGHFPRGSFPCRHPACSRQEGQAKCQHANAPPR